VHLRRARARAALGAVLLAGARRHLARILAMDVALRLCLVHAVVAGVILHALIDERLIALRVTAVEAIEELRIALRHALGAAGVRAALVGHGGAVAGARDLELERRALGGAPAGDLDPAVDAAREVERAARAVRVGRE